MKPRRTVALLIPFFLFALASGSAAARQPAVTMHVGAPIHPVEMANGQRLVYELHVDNDSGVPVELAALDVSAGKGKALLHLDRKALAADTDSQEGGTSVAAHASAVVYLSVDAGNAAPASIRHRLTVEQENHETVVAGRNIPVMADRGPMLAPPLAGGPWVAVYSDTWPRGHRRVFIRTNGRARLPGRFAIDWMKVDRHGRTLKDDSGLAASSCSYGAKVLAVADARVAATRDGVTEAERIADNKTHPHPDAAGNFISLDLGNGQFATYEHLRRGTLRVARGERVHHGQVLAEVGFSGDSTEPHLHFHVSDSPMPLEGEGLPYMLDQFRVTGRVTDWSAFGSRPWPELQPRIAEHEFPESGDVVDFAVR